MPEQGRKCDLISVFGFPVFIRREEEGMGFKKSAFPAGQDQYTVIGFGLVA